MDLIPVDHDPFANAQPPAVPNGVTLQPVDHDPWAPYVNPETGRPEISVSKAPAEGVVAKSGQTVAQPSVAEQVAGFPQRAADMTIGALGPIGEAGMTVGDMLRTGHVDPRDIPQVAGGVMLGVAAPEAEEAAPLEAGAEAVAKGITAYHGSPYDFDKFDLSKIGTGEGAQAYGHGLYFAQNPATAQSYKDDLAAMQRSAAQRALDQSGGDVDAAISSVKSEIDRLNNLPNAGNDASRRDRFVQLNEEKLAQLNAYKNTGTLNPGKMYQVSINADPEHFLDWDKPLSEQSPQVQMALFAAGGTFPKGLPYGEMRDKYLTPINDALKGTQAGRFLKADDILNGNANFDALRESFTGQPDKLNQILSVKAAYDAHPTLFENQDLSQTGARSYSKMTDSTLASPQGFGVNADEPQEIAASRALRQAGIPGIKYLDQGSRGVRSPEQAQQLLESARADLAKDPTNQQRQIMVQQLEKQAVAPSPTKNYVVFDDKLIDIIKKYGLAGLIAGGASHFATQPVDHDPFAAQSP